MPKYKIVPKKDSLVTIYPICDIYLESFERMYNSSHKHITDDYDKGFCQATEFILNGLGYQIVEEGETEKDSAPAATEAEFTTEVGESKFSVSKDEIEVIGKNIQITGLKTPGDIS